MKHIKSFEDFVNESNVNEAKKEKFLLYTNPNNATNKAYVVVGSQKVRDVLKSAKQYRDSYLILHQGNGTNDDLQKAKKMFSDYSFSDSVIIESEEVNESNNPEGDKKVLSFVNRLAKDWDIPTKDAIRFIESSLKKIK